MIVSLTGHRSQAIGGFITPNPTYNYIIKELKQILQQLSPTKALSGMALGSDQIFAEVCISLNIPVVACIPFINQEKIWPQHVKDKYHQILNKCSEQVIVSPGGYSAHKMQIRNEYLVDNCDILIGVFNGSKGGTYNCLEYAKFQNKQIILINPDLANG